MPMRIIKTTPPTIPTFWKLAGVARIPIPTNSFSMFSTVLKVLTLPVTVPSPYS